MCSKLELRKSVLALVLIGGFTLLSGCRPSGGGESTGEAELPMATISVTPTVTITPLPLAIRVNDGGILLSEYEAEVERRRATAEESGKDLTETKLRQQVIQDFIDQLLLAQAAEQAGFQVDEGALDGRIERLASQMGGAENLSAWQVRHGYDGQSFRLALRRMMAAEWQRNRIIAEVPDAVEQVQARQILLLDEELARQVFGQLEAGADFATTARRYYPATGGEMGWFPRGYLTLPEIEAAAFSLSPGEYSEVIESVYGFHIVQMMERSPSRPLSSEARRVLQHNAVAAWLEAQRIASQIELMVAQDGDT